MSTIYEARHAEQVARMARIARTIAEYHAITGVEFRVTCEANPPMADELNRVIGQMQSDMDVESRVFAMPIAGPANYHDGTGDRIVEYLRKHTGATTQEIAGALSDDPSRISSLLRGLRGRGIVASGARRVGRHSHRGRESLTWSLVK